MFQNVQWKLLTVIVIIAIAVVVAILGFPGNKGVFGMNLRFGTDLRGGSRLVYTLENVEVAQIEVNIRGQRKAVLDSINALRDDTNDYDELIGNILNTDMTPDKLDHAVNGAEHGQLEAFREALNKEAKILDSRDDKTTIDLIDNTIKSVDILKDWLQQLKQVNSKFEEGKKEYVNKVCDVLRNRLDASKLGGIVVRPYGEDRVQIILPEAIRNEDNIKKIIKSSGQIFWRIEAPAKYKGKVKYPNFPEGSGADEYRWYEIEKENSAEGYKVGGEWDQVGTKKYILIGWKPKESRVNPEFMNGESLHQVSPSTDENMRLAVSFEFKETEKSKFGRFTEQYQKGNFTGSEAPRLCVIFNEKVFWAGEISERIDGSGRMSGFQNRDEQNAMVNLLSAGSLPVTLVEEGDSTTGAELGQNSIRQGIIAILIGGIVVLVFILFYYLGAGVIANFALISNLFLLLGIMVLFQATLTLPGIAGIILTIGMSIDANILIFERIREEKRKTGNLKDAIQRGFDRAIVTILDAQITTILTAFILALVGTAEIQGFAITLIIGIAASLFTSLLVSRYLIGFLVSMKVFKKFSMLQMVGSPKFKFLNFRAPMFSVSTILIVIGLFVFTVRGTQNLGIDFLGGMEFHVALEENADVNDVRKAFAEIKDEDGNPKYEDIRIIAAYPQGAISSGTHTNQFVITDPAKGSEEDVNREVLKQNMKLDIERVFNGVNLPRLVQSGVDAYLGQSKTAQFKITVPFKNALDPNKLGYIQENLPIYLGEVMINENDSLEGIIEINEEENANAGEGAETKPVPRYVFKIIDTVLMAYIIDVPVNLRQFDEKSIKDQCIKNIETFLTERSDKIIAKRSEREIGFKAYPYVGKLLLSFNIDTAFPKAEFTEEHQANLVNALTDEVSDVTGLTNVKIGSKVVTKADRESGLLMDSKFFDLLGITRTATDEAIENAYKTKKEEFKDNVDKLELIDEAYKTLINENTKKAYENRLIGFVVEMGEDTQFADIDDDDPNTRLNPDNLMLEIEKAVHLFLNPNDLKERGEGYTPRSVPSPFLRQEIIGQTIATDMQEQATWAIIISLLVIVIYIWVRFRNFKYGLGATIALAHDVMFALGAIAVFDALDIVNVKIDLTVIAALLTIIGYSLNDTIVVFDRIRENLVGTKKSSDIKPYINSAINQTLSRTLLTSFTTFVVVFILLLLGTQVLEGFAFTLFIGVIVGTYSSIFIASPILTANWAKAKKLIIYLGIAGFILGGLVYWIGALHFLPFIGAAPFLSMVLYAFVFVGVTIWLYSWYDFFTTSVSKDDEEKKSEKKTESFTKKEEVKEETSKEEPYEESKDEEAVEEKKEEEKPETKEELKKEEPKKEESKPKNQGGSKKAGSKGKGKGKGKGKKKK